MDIEEQYDKIYRYCYFKLYDKHVFGEYTLPIFGQYLVPWQAAPILYLLSGAVIAALGKPIYQRFQVSGR